MLRILLMLVIAMLPLLLFAVLVIWALGAFGYAPLQPLSHSIGEVARPVLDPLGNAAKNLLAELLGHLPGAQGRAGGAF